MTFKVVRPTFLFYAVATATIFLLEKFFPSGPCMPGLGVLSFFILFPIVIGLLIRNVYLTVSGNKGNLGVVILHAIALITLLVIMAWH